MSWHLPPAEAALAMHQCDSGGDGRINFEEFYKNMMPLWAFGSKVGEEERWGEKSQILEMWT